MIIHNDIKWDKRTQPGPVLCIVRTKCKATARARRLLIKRSRHRTTLSFWVGSSTINPAEIETDIKIRGTLNGGLETCVGSLKAGQSAMIHGANLEQK